jgi:hypothetical protein
MSALAQPAAQAQIKTVAMRRQPLPGRGASPVFMRFSLSLSSEGSFEAAL